jgi:hypothetical protein
MDAYRFEVAFDGPALQDHSIDVQDLAPALLGLGDLIREVNAEFNGDKSKVNLLVTANFEHKCFNVNLELVQSIYETIKTFLEDPGVKSAKDLLEWIQLIAGGTVAGGFGLLGYWKLKNGRKVANVTEVTEKDGRGSVVVRFEGDSNSVTVNQHVYNLGENPKAAAAALKALPVQTGKIEKVEVRTNGDSLVFTPETVAPIQASCNAVRSAEDVPLDDPQPITAHLRVYSPVYDPKAAKWRFMYGGHPIYADITETTIAKDAIARGGALINDLYRVRMTVTEYKTQTGQFRHEHKIIEVLKFLPAPPGQPGLFEEPT